MEALSYSELRHKLKKVMGRVCDTYEPVIVVRLGGEKTVMLSYEEGALHLISGRHHY